MSTRCLIGIEYDDKTIRYIYCHCDGYIEGVGKTLKKHYTDIDTIHKLLDLGNISSLGEIPEAGSRVECDLAFRRYMENQTEANKKLMEEAWKALHTCCDVYGGEDEVACCVANRAEYLNIQSDAEYRYLFAKNKWLVQRHSSNSFRPYNIKDQEN